MLVMVELMKSVDSGAGKSLNMINTLPCLV